MSDSSHIQSIRGHVIAASTARHSRHTVPRLEATIASVLSNITAWNNTITAFPVTGGNLTDALEIHSAAVSLNSSFDTATLEVKLTGPLDKEDGSRIGLSVERLEPSIFDALGAIVMKKPAFAALPSGDILDVFLSDLKSLQSACRRFVVEIRHSLERGSRVQLELRVVEDNVSNAFDSVIAAYKGSYRRNI